MFYRLITVSDPTSIETLRQRLVDRLTKAQGEVVRCEKALEGLDLASKIAGIGGRGRRADGAEKASHGKLAEAVRGYISAAPPEFTVDDILGGLKPQAAILNGSLNRDSITAVLRRLVRKKMVGVTQPGKGRRPGKYCCLIELPEKPESEAASTLEIVDYFELPDVEAQK
jgi:hypothetical protein